MSSPYFVIVCPYSDDNCDEYGYDCPYCPFYNEEDDED